MTERRQQPLIDQLAPTISRDRLGSYLTAASFDADTALALYVWNARVGEAFHLPIQAVEVGLRNRINETFCRVFGPDWWKEDRFERLLDRAQADDIATARRRIINRKAPLVTGQIVAGLSFGFWVGMLQPRYNPDIWSAELRTTFPNLPANKTRFDLAAGTKRVADLRNRIWHHEPLIRMSLSEEYGAVMQALTWICPVKAAWIRPMCRVPELLRAKPKPPRPQRAAPAADAAPVPPPPPAKAAE